MTATDLRNAKDIQKFLATRWKEHKSKLISGLHEMEDGRLTYFHISRLSAPSSLVEINLEKDGSFSSCEGIIDEEKWPVTSFSGLYALCQKAKEEPFIGLSLQSMPAKKALDVLGLAGGPSWLARESVHCFSAALEDPRLEARVPREDLIGVENKRFWESGLSRVNDAVDKDVLDLFKAVDNFRWRDYRFFSARHVTDESTVNRRRQAAKSYPLALELLASRPSLKSAIDNERPLAELLQASFGTTENGAPRVSKAVLKRLHGIDWPTGGLSIQLIAETLSNIPVDWFPKDRENWDAFCDVTATVGKILPEATFSDIKTLYSGASRNWVDYRRRLAKACTDTRPPEGYEPDVIPTLEAKGTKALAQGVDWKLLTALGPAELPQAVEQQIRLCFDKGLLPEEELSNGEVIEWMTSMASFIRVRDALDWKLLGTVPGNKVEAAALAMAKAIPDLPTYMNAEDLADWAKRIVSPDESRTALAGACNDTVDMLNMFASKILLPAASQKSKLGMVYLSHFYREEGRSVAASILTEGQSAIAILENSRYFHSQFEAFLDAGSPPKVSGEMEASSDYDTVPGLGVDQHYITDDGWAPLCPIVRAPNNIYIVPLTTPGLLKQEGRKGLNSDGSQGLHHCVGGYAGRCRQGSHIISFRQKHIDGFQRLATAHIERLVTGQKELEIPMYKGMRNREPPMETKVALKWFQAQINSGAIKLNYDGIQEYLAKSQIKCDEVERECGYDWRKVESIEEAMYPWGRIVPKKYRKMGFEEFIEQPEIIRLATILNPGIQSQYEEEPAAGLTR